MEPKPLPKDMVTSGKTGIVGMKIDLLIRAGLDERELSVTLYHEILEAAAVASDGPARHRVAEHREREQWSDEIRESRASHDAFCAGSQALIPARKARRACCQEGRATQRRSRSRSRSGRRRLAEEVS